MDADYRNAKALACGLVAKGWDNLPYEKPASKHPSEELAAAHVAFLEVVSDSLGALGPDVNRWLCAAFNEPPGQHISVVKRDLLRLREIAQRATDGRFPQWRDGLNALTYLHELSQFTKICMEWDWACVQPDPGTNRQSPSIVVETKPTAEPDDLLTHVEAADLADVSDRTIRRWLKDGKLRGHGSARRVSKSELREKLPELRERRPRTPNRT
ncbi:MAG: helix-turn-helix domain-containing protein [Phycisphaerales bacterium]|nr:MAG: helix-turn-helix domain-containing protein [Phycisphaerales bacterium]